MTIKQHLEETYNNSFKKRKSDAVKIEGEQKTQTKNNSIKKNKQSKSPPKRYTHKILLKEVPFKPITLKPVCFCD
jgi:hypothetical protein